MLNANIVTRAGIPVNDNEILLTFLILKFYVTYYFCVMYCPNLSLLLDFCMCLQIKNIWIQFDNLLCVVGHNETSLHQVGTTHGKDVPKLRLCLLIPIRMTEKFRLYSSHKCLFAARIVRHWYE